MKLTDQQIDKIVSFWTRYIDRPINAEIFKQNLINLLNRVKSTWLSVDYSSTQPLHTLLYGGEYAGLTFKAANNVLDTEPKNRLIGYTWTYDKINMDISKSGEISYSIGRMPFENLETWRDPWERQKELDIRPQELDIRPNAQNRLTALVLSERFLLVEKDIISVGKNLLETNEDHDAILAGTAILAISYAQYYGGYTKKTEDIFNKRFGTRGFYPISYPKLTSQLSLTTHLYSEVEISNAISTIGRAALAREIPFSPENFAGCGFYDTHADSIQTSQDKTLYQRLYQQQENDRYWRKIGRAILVGLSVLAFIIPAYFTYQWMKRENELDEKSKEDDEIKLVQLSKEQYDTYVGNKKLRKKFKTENDLNKYKISDKPKKYVSIDKKGNANIYMNSRAKARYDFFSQNLHQSGSQEYHQNLPVTSCTTLRHR